MTSKPESLKRQGTVQSSARAGKRTHFGRAQFELGAGFFDRHVIFDFSVKTKIQRPKGRMQGERFNRRYKIMSNEVFGEIIYPLLVD